jgi:hypothetical protein
VLHLYNLPLDEKRPLVCFDERPVQLLGEVCAPLPMKAGKPHRYDYEYEREGTACLLVAFEGVFKVRVVGAERLDGRRGASSVTEVICRTRVLRHGPGSRTRSARRLRCTATMIPDP